MWKTPSYCKAFLFDCVVMTLWQARLEVLHCLTKKLIIRRINKARFRTRLTGDGGNIIPPARLGWGHKWAGAERWILGTGFVDPTVTHTRAHGSRSWQHRVMFSFHSGAAEVCQSSVHWCLYHSDASICLLGLWHTHTLGKYTYSIFKLSLSD